MQRNLILFILISNERNLKQNVPKTKITIVP